MILKVRKRAKIANRYNQAPHLTQDTNGKVTTSQLDITHESQEISPFPAGDHKAVTNRRAKQNWNNINKPQKKHRLGTASKTILLEGLNQFNGAPTSPLVQMWIKTPSRHNCTLFSIKVLMFDLYVRVKSQIFVEFVSKKKSTKAVALKLLHVEVPYKPDKIWKFQTNC